ncbi:MAG: PhnD/SsuA/transferrin family substrate-binding protein [Phyllobacteriaceae bacterium]|nr:PhnD/SsuA/transferrin family substrate-binding protein [Phyllobacteriaceae bacterium]
MIAGLPMYDWPELQAGNDTLWQDCARWLALKGIAAPNALTRTGDLYDLWLSPQLLLAQTCSYPLETALRGKVSYVATPSYDCAGCEVPGHYRSVIIMAGAGAPMPVPDHTDAALPDWPKTARLAYNGRDSMSGWQALARDLAKTGRAMPMHAFESGSHRQSIQMVANGQADLAAIDCVSWAHALAWEPAARHVHVAGWTAMRPGLPLITRLGCTEAELDLLRDMARRHFDAVVLSAPTER